MVSLVGDAPARVPALNVAVPLAAGVSVPPDPPVESTQLPTGNAPFPPVAVRVAVGFGKSDVVEAPRVTPGPMCTASVATAPFASVTWTLSSTLAVAPAVYVVDAPALATLPCTGAWTENVYGAWPS